MRKILVAACCAAVMGSISVASAQTTGPQGQQTMKSNDGMDANAKMMKKKKMKKGMMKSGGMSGGGMSKGGMMDKGGMSK
jgi:pentapeptide MXKDX repeat protein